MEQLENKNISISILIPCYNEEEYIEQTLNSIIKQKHNFKQEIFIIDGKSTDNTVQKIRPFLNNNIKLLFNENKTKPFALNLGIKNSTGDYVVIVDCHSTYPKTYINRLVKFISNNPEYGNAGFPVNTVPANNSATSKAISLALSSSFGVGNSLFRIGIDKVQDVDTVPFGCFPADVFKKVGYFDEILTRNQDDEFNSRLIKNGYKIALLPDLTINYIARKNFKLLSKMMYQYGLFKPIVNKKIGSPTTLRQFAPPTLVATIPLSIFPYLIFLIFAFISSFKKNRNVTIAINFCFSIIAMHISYGIGYLFGLIKVMNGKNNFSVSSSR